MHMTKKRYMFAPARTREFTKPKDAPGPRVFLAAMLIAAGLSGVFEPGPARQGPVAQFAIRLVQELQATAGHAHIAP
jgi:hypothetical protein